MSEALASDSFQFDFLLSFQRIFPQINTVTSSTPWTFRVNSRLDINALTTASFFGQFASLRQNSKLLRRACCGASSRYLNTKIIIIKKEEEKPESRTDAATSGPTRWEWTVFICLLVFVTNQIKSSFGTVTEIFCALICNFRLPLCENIPSAFPALEEAFYRPDSGEVYSPSLCRLE